MINGETLPDDKAVGTEFDYTDRLFWYYQDGQALLPSEINVAQIDDFIRADGKGRAIEQVLTLPIRAAKWSIRPAKGDRGEADMVTAALEPAMMQTVIGQITSAQLYRRSYLEKTFRVDGDQVVYDELGFRPAATCELARNQDTGKFDGFWQWAYTGFGDIKHVQIPRQRAFVYIHGQYRAPWAGVSELETAYAIFEVKQKIRWLWYQFLENHSMPKGIATAGTNRSPADLAKAAAKLKGSGVIGLHPDEKLAPYNTDSQGAEQYKAALDYLDTEMTGSVLASFLELAGATRGSYALSADQTDFFLKSREAIAREIEAAITGSRLMPGLIDDLVRYNFGPNAAIPRFQFAPLSILDAKSAITLMGQIAASPPGSTAIPAEFVNLLIEQVAAYLGMDVDKVAKGIEQAAQAAAPGAPQLAAAVDTAKGLVERAKQQPAAAGQPANPAA